jgi:hypothetical protein
MVMQIENIIQIYRIEIELDNAGGIPKRLLAALAGDTVQIRMQCEAGQCTVIYARNRPPQAE